MITNASFEITPTSLAPAEKLTFNQRIKKFSNGGSFSNDEILAGVQGNKTGYKLKNITAVTPTDMSWVIGNKPHLGLTLNKIGTFTATIILEHPTKKDATIENASFEIIATPAEKLTFSKRTKRFSNGKFSSGDILQGVQGNKTGYTLKSITSINPTDIADVNGVAPYLSLSMNKGGTFTAVLILEHPSKGDAVITNASFEITSHTTPPAPAEKLTFKGLRKAFSGSMVFTSAEIIKGVQGNKTGYTLKTITAVKPANIAGIIGSKPYFSVTLNKIGVCTATIILEHPTKKDATIQNCRF